MATHSPAYDPATEKLEPPVHLAPAAALAALAVDLEFEGLTRLAARARAICRQLGYLAVAVDQLSADATMLAAHAPGVTVEARAAGERLMAVLDADVDETADEYDEPDPDLAHDRRVADQLGVL
ncbi:hypothetical protein [Nocardia farcinica]|uniref:hypothetical protein n=1 Tax=Nocardia farcinica TaxID=37329 RepID=UPI0018938C07|nr:hypothetical protein [Nocardia farcinica]MBF6291839.1 hypothetical protein [Nocardia farcinica]